MWCSLILIVRECSQTSVFTKVETYGNYRAVVNSFGRSFFRTADAAIVFFDLTKEDSYTAMEDWYDAVIKANGRKGSEPLPILVVGTKADDIKGRDIKPEAIEFPRKKELPYREISSNANYGVKELLLDVCKALLGDSVQLTDQVELDKPKIDKIDQEQLEKLYSEYEKASK